MLNHRTTTPLLSFFIKCFALFIFVICKSASAAPDTPQIAILPNVNTTYLMTINATQALSFQSQAIELVKTTLSITPSSPYRAVQIYFIYNNKNKPEALIVYLLSSKYKSIKIVRINLNNNFTVASVTDNYHIEPNDLMQSPAYAQPVEPKCPNNSVQFVLGNNFTGNGSVEKEIQTVYRAALKKGYHPVLLDTNYPRRAQQPTIQAYENWLSCPGVKGFYNESHGNTEGILLSDGFFDYTLVDKNLVKKLNQDVILFDSCETFNNPLLDSMVNSKKGDSQQYIAGVISLPFGSSERTASCFWEAGLNQQPLTLKLLNECAEKYGLEQNAFGIEGNGSQYVSPPVD
jgi:hypothetical protein